MMKMVNESHSVVLIGSNDQDAWVTATCYPAMHVNEGDVGWCFVACLAPVKA